MVNPPFYSHSIIIHIDISWWMPVAGGFAAILILAPMLITIRLRPPYCILSNQLLFNAVPGKVIHIQTGHFFL